MNTFYGFLCLRTWIWERKCHPRFDDVCLGNLCDLKLKASRDSQKFPSWHNSINNAQSIFLKQSLLTIKFHKIFQTSLVTQYQQNLPSIQQLNLLSMTQKKTWKMKRKHSSISSVCIYLIQLHIFYQIALFLFSVSFTSKIR